jgi:hypothetical protein
MTSGIEHPGNDRGKWQAQLSLQREELALRRKETVIHYLEFRLKRQNNGLSRWSSPLVLAVLAAGLAAFGNAFVALINGNEQRALERTRAEAAQTVEETKAEAARILEAIKTSDVERARINLDFLNQLGLITNAKRRADIQNYLNQLKPGEGPSLPSSMALLESLGMNRDQIRAAQRLILDDHIPVDQQAARMIELANEFKEFQSLLEPSTVGPEIAESFRQALDAVKVGDLQEARRILENARQEAEKRDDEAQKRLDEARKRADDAEKRLNEQLEELNRLLEEVQTPTIGAEPSNPANPVAK